MIKQRKPRKRSAKPVFVALLGIVILLGSTFFIILALTGPKIGNIFSNISRGLSRDGGSAYGGAYVAQPPPASMDISGGTFEDYGINSFETTAQDALSTFAMDVDTASYTLARSYLIDYNQMPPKEAIRAEEFINYLPTDDAAPSDGRAFALHLSAAPSPFFAPNHLLLRVGIQGRRVSAEARDAATLIFVIDVSGSMDAPNRLALAKETLALLVPELREDDAVGIVIYSNSARIALMPTPASDQTTILNTIAALRVEGSTYAEDGLRLGYEMARQHVREGRTTRVILMSDGVANVGATGPEAILQIIRAGVDAGVTLSTVGFGMGTYNDVLMEQLANDGNGHYFYVDDLNEARRIFVNNLTSTLQVIAYDAKIQVAFNPQVVFQYRLIGYENRAVADSDFRNDTVDAGEVGAGHSVTALYELIVTPDIAGTLATVRIRYENAETRQMEEQSAIFTTDEIAIQFADMAAEFQIQAAMAQLAELLRNSPYAANASYQGVYDVVQPFIASHATAAEIAAMAQTAQTLLQR